MRITERKANKKRRNGDRIGEDVLVSVELQLSWIAHLQPETSNLECTPLQTSTKKKIKNKRRIQKCLV